MNLNDVTAVFIDGVEVIEIKINGITVWTKP